MIFFIEGYKKAKIASLQRITRQYVIRNVQLIGSWCTAMRDPAGYIPAELVEVTFSFLADRNMVTEV